MLRTIDIVLISKNAVKRVRLELVLFEGGYNTYQIVVPGLGITGSRTVPELSPLSVVYRIAIGYTYKRLSLCGS
jgi:hypothetical protein